MRPNETYDRFESMFDYPVDLETVIAATGDTAITAPTGTGESLATILDRTEVRTFHSARDLFETFTANLGEQYIGRKRYDDRGSNFGSGEADTI